MNDVCGSPTDSVAVAVTRSSVAIAMTCLSFRTSARGHSFSITYKSFNVATLFTACSICRQVDRTRWCFRNPHIFAVASYAAARVAKQSGKPPSSGVGSVVARSCVTPGETSATTAGETPSSIGTFGFFGFGFGFGFGFRIRFSSGSFSRPVSVQSAEPPRP